MKFRLIALATAFEVMLVSCGSQPQPRAPHVIETHWTDAAAKRTLALSNDHKLVYALPELRVYDARRRLIFHRSGFVVNRLGETLDQSIKADQPIAGPAFDETVKDLQTADNRPASAIVIGGGRVTVFDYWATWCVPCKAAEKELIAWLGTKPENSVQIVKAEADLMKASRAAGDRTFLLKRGPDGKLHKVELK